MRWQKGRFGCLVRLAWYGMLAGPLLTPAGASPTVDFARGNRVYETCTGLPQARYESEADPAKQHLSKQACDKLAAVLDEVKAALPVRAQVFFKDYPFFIMLGEQSSSGGLRSGMRFVRSGEPSRGNGHDPRWANGIVIYSADNLLYLSQLWSRKAVMHEMAHAWHISHWPEKHAVILNAWKASEKRGLYRGVQDVKGARLDKAYATVNQLEYFAELSAAYFVGINYAPYDRQGLGEYDPGGYRMVEIMWLQR
ncbi:hypothetical protein [Hydrogenophaga sp. 5NK40-0174]|uniref:hypothetical protein n=1 Tax=Hydrogenophaga sp. 5NK40-0174 TaxID=3127649 RepID=UPI0031040E66